MGKRHGNLLTGVLYGSVYYHESLLREFINGCSRMTRGSFVAVAAPNPWRLILQKYRDFLQMLAVDFEWRMGASALAPRLAAVRPISTPLQICQFESNVRVAIF